MTAAQRVVVAGNPNVGKTSLFNELTAARYQVGNYAGVTVETREGRVSSRFQPKGRIALVDLPGIYSLTALSQDETAAFDALIGAAGTEPDAVLLVVDASNLARNLYLALQILELGRPLVVALNMVDVAEQAGLEVDPEALERELGARVVPTVARTGRGARAVVEALEGVHGDRPEPRLLELPEGATALREVLGALAMLDGVEVPARARWLLTAQAAGTAELAGATDAELAALERIDPKLVEQAATELVIRRYREVDRILLAIGQPEAAREHAPTMRASERVDSLLTHRVWGTVAFLAVMALVFTSIFSWAEPVMDVIESGMAWVAAAVATALGPGMFTDLLTEGVIGGVGNVLVFVPQIALLFLFLGLMEDSGYLARAAFLLDRLMARVGLHGRAFVPLLSGYACAIPAILSTRTISSFKDRLVTILMIPFMSCSARLPIYTLVIATLFDEGGGLILLAMYLLSTASALAVGWLYKRTLLRSPTPPLVLELPPYRLPRLRNTATLVYDRTMDFIKSAGTVILAFTIILWALLSFPRVEHELPEGETAITHSYGGRLGKAIEPALEPIGQDWRMGVGIIGSFAAREVLISTLGLVYGMEADDDNQVSLREAIRSERDPATGKPAYSRLDGIALMVFFLYACQCMSTLAVVRRETGTWRWPMFMFVSMTALAYVAALLVYQVGLALGYG